MSTPSGKCEAVKGLRYRTRQKPDKLLSVILDKFGKSLF